MVAESAGEIFPGKRQLPGGARAGSARRAEIDRPALAAPTAPLAGSAGCRWLMPAAEMAGLVNGGGRPSADPSLMGRACPPRIAMRTFSADAGSVRAARDFTIATLSRWGAALRSQDITVVVSELLTNALRHAVPRPGDARNRYSVRLGLLQQKSWVMCAVADPSQAVPVPQIPGSLAESGRGLQMICALADRWGYTSPGDAGKVVWAMFYSRPKARA